MLVRLFFVDEDLEFSNSSICFCGTNVFLLGGAFEPFGFGDFAALRVDFVVVDFLLETSLVSLLGFGGGLRGDFGVLSLDFALLLLLVTTLVFLGPFWTALPISK